jgi:tetratricopeptide (TPR) repeat protein
LRTYWQPHLTDEDVLRPLLEILGEQERYQEGEACYQHALEALQEEGRDPDTRTQDIAEYLRAKQIQRERVATDSGKAAESIAPPLLTPSHMQQDGYPALSSAITQGIIEAVRQGITVATQQLERPFMDSIRRNLIQGLITPTAIIGLKRDIFPFFTNSQNSERLAPFQQELATRWEVYHTGETRLTYQGLGMWIGDVTAFTQDSKGDMLYKQILECLCMSFQLQGSLYRDMMEFDEAHTSYHKAFEIAKEMENAEYQACALARRGVGFIQQEMPDEAIAYLNEALKLIQRSFLPSLSGYIFQALSEAHAMAQHDYESQCSIEQAQKALEHRGQALERSLCQPNTTSVISQQGVNAVLLHKDSKALELIGKGLEKYSPALNRGRARLKAQKAEAYYGLGLIDLCCTEATETWLLARSIGSNKTLARLRKVHLNLVLSRWKKEQSVLDLGWVIANM